MAWYNSSWMKRQPIVLTGTGVAQSDYQVKLAVTYDSDMKSDFSDLRFTKADGTTLIDAWLESKIDDTSAIIWVETDTPANTIEANIYMYYGNAAAVSDWNCGNTFIFGDDFEGTSLNTVATTGDVAVADDPTQYEGWAGLAKNAAGELFVTYRTSDTNTHMFDATGRVVIKKSTDNGLTWGGEVLVVDEPGIDDRVGGGLAIFDDAGIETIIITYFEMESDTSIYRGYAVKSIDNGVTWGTKIAMSPGNMRAPGVGATILLSNGKLLCPLYHYQGNVTCVAESSDGGDTWTEYVVSAIHGDEFSIIETKTGGSYTGAVYGIIRDETTPYIYKKVTSTDYGHTWSGMTDEPVFDDPYKTPLTFFRTHDDKLLAVYTRDTSDSLELYESTDEGINWDHKCTVVHGASISYYPMIEQIDSSKLIISWCVNGATSDIYVNFVDYPLSNHRWVEDEGTVTVANSEVTLDNIDFIYNPVKYVLPFEWRAKINFVNTTDYMLYGVKTTPYGEPTAEGVYYQALIAQKDYPTSNNNSAYTQNSTHMGAVGDHIYGFKYKAGEVKWYYDDALIDTFVTNIPDEPLWTYFDHRTGTHKVDWVMVAKYVDNPATYAFGGEETETGWTGKIISITNPAKVFDIVVANISKVMGV